VQAELIYPPLALEINHLRAAFPIGRSWLIVQFSYDFRHAVVPSGARDFSP
jgi:hypothetical protein